MSTVTESVVRDETALEIRAETERSGTNAADRAAFSSRGFTSLLLTIIFLALGFSGVMLYLMPRGRLANWSDWQLLGLAKDEWVRLHVNVSILFLVVAVLHLVINWSLFWGYLRKRAVRGLAMPKELFAAVVVSALFVAGPILDYPPFRSIMVLNTHIKDYWERMEASSSNTALTDSRNSASRGVSAAQTSGGQEVPQDTVGGGMHGGGPSGEGFGQGRGMGWGRGMGGGMGMGLGQGRGPGYGRVVEEETATLDTTPPEGPPVPEGD